MLLPTFQNSAAFAATLDASDALRDFRAQFYIPTNNGKEHIYLCGNSLGLQPKSVRAYLEQELIDWQNLGVEGHLHAKNPWLYYHHFLEESAARLVGAKPIEVVVMNSLTVNLNLLMISFYRPTKKRYKIMMEYMAFPSDQYAVENQIKLHGFDANDAIIELMPRAGENNISTADILAQISLHKDELALIIIGGVNYYTGQLFDMQKITTHAKNCSQEIVVGYDLAHAAGNVLLNLHDWDVDFATWCSYKYLNSGPGGTSGVFVHEKHANDNSLPRLSGWWGNDESIRFLMRKEFKPMVGAEGWQQSNAPILSMAAHLASLNIFEQAGIENLRNKSIRLTAFTEFLILEKIRATKNIDVEIITPSNQQDRGCQLSLRVKQNGKQIHQKLTAANFICDWREPDVIRIAPVPLYNTYQDVFHFTEAFFS